MQSKTNPTAHPLMELGIIAGILAAASLIGLLFFAFGFSDANIITIFILGVLVASITTTRRVYGAVISLFSVLLFNYLFTEPRFSLHAYNPEYPFTFFIMFTASMLTSSLTAKVKFQAVQQAQKARLSEILLETSQMLQQAENSTDIIQKTSRQVVRLLNRNVTFSPFQPVDEDAKDPPEMREDASGLHLTVRSNRQIFAAVHVDTKRTVRSMRLKRTFSFPCWENAPSRSKRMRPTKPARAWSSRRNRNNCGPICYGPFPMTSEHR